MDYNEEYRKIFKKKLLDTFKYTASFLEKHNLKYWACAGTCIGAVRHHGVIPWDDDIDIMMPHDDYYKLLDLRDTMKGSGYSMACNQDKGYYYEFGKIMDENTTIVEFKFLPFVFGVYVDVFPVCQTNSDKSEIYKNIDYYDRHFHGKFNQISYHVSFFDIISHPNVEMLRVLFGRHGYLKAKLEGYYSRNKLYNDWAEFEKNLNKNIGDKYVSYIEGYPGRKIYDKVWFDESVDMPFEDTTIKVPGKYDKYLTHVYGDYMTLPPEEKRVSLHKKYYTNLRERLDICEIRRRIEKGETLVY